MTDGSLPREGSGLTHRLVEIPLRADGDRADGRHRLLGPLAVAHGAGRPVVVSWLRTRAHGPVQVLVGGAEAGSGTDEVQVAFPPGARGRRQSSEDTAGVLAGLSWQQAELALDAGSGTDETHADRIEDLFALYGEPMGFLVVARPVAAEQIAAAIDALSDEVARLEGLRSGRGVHRRQLARAERNLEYLDRSAGSGCWSLELWTGGIDATGARVAAAMLAGSADLAEVPLLARPAQTVVDGQPGGAMSVVVGADAVAALARPPFRELPGVRVTPLPEFDQNVEDRIQLRLGTVLDGARSPAAPFGVSFDSVNRHVFVSGATGSGKSETVRALLWALNQHGVPWMVIEPAKAEYSALAPWLDPGNPMVVIRPGVPDAPPPMINPLEPSSLLVGGVRHTFPLQTHLDMVKALFTASFDAEEPFPQVLSAGLTRAYQARGWNLVTGTASDPALSPPEWPVLGDLVRESLGVVEGLGYGAEVRDNMRGFIRVRIESLRSGTPGRFFEGGYPIDLDDLLGRPVVFEVEDLGDDRDKAFFIGSLVIRLVEQLRLRQKHGLRKPGLSHVLVIEEAHRLLRRVAEESPSAHAVTMFANLLAEIRSYGEGVVVAEQIPSKVIPDLVKNSAVKIMHRLPAEDDRRTVGATMNLTDDQSAHVVALEPGTAVAHSAGMDRPVLVRIDRVGARDRTGAATSAPRLGPRSAAIPAESATHRFTLAQFEASRALATPAVVLWAEQTVVGHLTWDELGTPAGSWFERLRAADTERVRCAIGLVVADSVARRLPLVREWHDPAAFITDVADRMAEQAATGRGIKRPPWRWAVGQFRNLSVRLDLRGDPAGADTSLPHPRSAHWAGAGFDLPGPSWDEQLTQLDARYRVSTVWPALLAGAPPVLDDVARSLGCAAGTEANRISRAVGALGLDRRWLARRVGASDA
ncbi:MAG: ATP-binding protein [Sporichthyaceae bacterium]